MMKDKKQNSKLDKEALKKVAGGGPNDDDEKDDLPPIAKYLYEENWTEEEEIDRLGSRENSPGRWKSCWVGDIFNLTLDILN